MNNIEEQEKLKREYLKYEEVTRGLSRREAAELVGMYNILRNKSVPGLEVKEGKIYFFGHPMGYSRYEVGLYYGGDKSLTKQLPSIVDRISAGEFLVDCEKLGIKALSVEFLESNEA